METCPTCRAQVAMADRQPHMGWHAEQTAMGLDGPEVDVTLGGEEPMVDEWETGDRVPTFEDVERLSGLTGYPVAFFFAPMNDGPFVMFMCGPDGCRVHREGDEPAEPCAHCAGTGLRRP
jgi:hypothetical protein